MGVNDWSRQAGIWHALDAKNEAFAGARNAEIEKLFREGASYAELARQFDLSPSRVSQIVANRGRMRSRIEIGLNAPLRHMT